MSAEAAPRFTGETVVTDEPASLPPTSSTPAPAPEEDEPGWDCRVHGNGACGPAPTDEAGFVAWCVASGGLAWGTTNQDTCTWYAADGSWTDSKGNAGPSTNEEGE